MTLRTVTPASGAAQITIAWDGGAILAAGQVLDVVPGSAHETAIGAGNLTALSAAALVSNVTGSDPAATSNS